MFIDVNTRKYVSGQATLTAAKPSRRHIHTPVAAVRPKEKPCSQA